jgi:hypothetical protein
MDTMRRRTSPSGEPASAQTRRPMTVDICCRYDNRRSSTQACGAIGSQAVRESIFRTGTTSTGDSRLGECRDGGSVGVMWTASWVCGDLWVSCVLPSGRPERVNRLDRKLIKGVWVACRPESVDLGRYDGRGGRVAGSGVPRAG